MTTIGCCFRISIGEVAVAWFILVDKKMDW